jgi:hypothetical protein
MAVLPSAPRRPIFAAVHQKGTDVDRQVGQEVRRTAEQLRVISIATRSWAQATQERSRQIVRESRACLNAALHTYVTHASSDEPPRD